MMSAPEKIAAEPRTEFGKGAARRIRREDKIPAVIYGHGNDPVHVILPGHQTMMALKHGGANALLSLDVDGTEQLALTKDIQVDPIRRVIEHLDFVAVRRGEKVTVDVPIHVVGEAGPDTLVVNENTVVSVEAEATHIPEFFEVSVEGAAAGTMIPAKDLDLPSGTTLLADEELLIVNVTEQISAEALEAELEEAEADLGIEHDASDAELAEAQTEAIAEDAAVEAGESTESTDSE
jgi:large subunit ribosomal protein L25